MTNPSRITNRNEGGVNFTRKVIGSAVPIINHAMFNSFGKLVGNTPLSADFLFRFEKMQFLEKPEKF